MEVAACSPSLPYYELDNLVQHVSRIEKEIMLKLSSTIPPARTVHTYKRLSFEDYREEPSPSEPMTSLDLRKVIPLIDKIHNEFFPLVNKAKETGVQAEVYPQALAWHNEIAKNYDELCKAGWTMGVPRYPLTP